VSSTIRVRAGNTGCWLTRLQECTARTCLVANVGLYAHTCTKNQVRSQATHSSRMLEAHMTSSGAVSKAMRTQKGPIAATHPHTYTHTRSQARTGKCRGVLRICSFNGSRWLAYTCVSPSTCTKSPGRSPHTYTHVGIIALPGHQCNVELKARLVTGAQMDELHRARQFDCDVVTRTVLVRCRTCATMQVSSA
jgi:hypothetical protein